MRSEPDTFELPPSGPLERTSKDTALRRTVAIAARAVGMLALLTVITGVAYPLAVTAIAQAFFADEANGSLLVDDGKVRGSVLIGQSFESPKYFWGRLSATKPVP